MDSVGVPEIENAMADLIKTIKAFVNDKMGAYLAAIAFTALVFFMKCSFFWLYWFPNLLYFFVLKVFRKIGIVTSALALWLFFRSIIVNSKEEAQDSSSIMDKKELARISDNFLKLQERLKIDCDEFRKEQSPREEEKDSKDLYMSYEDAKKAVAIIKKYGVLCVPKEISKRYEVISDYLKDNAYLSKAFAGWYEEDVRKNGDLSFNNEEMVYFSYLDLKLKMAGDELSKQKCKYEEYKKWLSEHPEATDKKVDELIDCLQKEFQNNKFEEGLKKVRDLTYLNDDFGTWAKKIEEGRSSEGYTYFKTALRDETYNYTEKLVDQIDKRKKYEKQENDEALYKKIMRLVNLYKEQLSQATERLRYLETFEKSHNEYEAHISAAMRAEDGVKESSTRGNFFSGWFSGGGSNDAWSEKAIEALKKAEKLVYTSDKFAKWYEEKWKAGKEKSFVYLEYKGKKAEISDNCLQKQIGIYEKYQNLKEDMVDYWKAEYKKKEKLLNRLETFEAIKDVIYVSDQFAKWYENRKKVEVKNDGKEESFVFSYNGKELKFSGNVLQRQLNLYEELKKRDQDLKSHKEALNNLNRIVNEKGEQWPLKRLESKFLKIAYLTPEFSEWYKGVSWNKEKRENVEGLEFDYEFKFKNAVWCGRAYSRILSYKGEQLKELVKNYECYNAMNEYSERENELRNICAAYYELCYYDYLKDYGNINDVAKFKESINSYKNKVEEIKKKEKVVDASLELLKFCRKALNNLLQNYGEMKSLFGNNIYAKIESYKNNLEQKLSTITLENNLTRKKFLCNILNALDALKKYAEGGKKKDKELVYGSIQEDLRIAKSCIEHYDKNSSEKSNKTNILYRANFENLKDADEFEGMVKKVEKIVEMRSLCSNILKQIREKFLAKEPNNHAISAETLKRVLGKNNKSVIAFLISFCEDVQNKNLCGDIGELERVEKEVIKKIKVAKEMKKEISDAKEHHDIIEKVLGVIDMRRLGNRLTAEFNVNYLRDHFGEYGDFSEWCEKNIYTNGKETKSDEEIKVLRYRVPFTHEVSSRLFEGIAEGGVLTDSELLQQVKKYEKNQREIEGKAKEYFKDEKSEGTVNSEKEKELKEEIRSSLKKEYAKNLDLFVKSIENSKELEDDYLFMLRWSTDFAVQGSKRKITEEELGERLKKAKECKNKINQIAKEYEDLKNKADASVMAPIFPLKFFEKIIVPICRALGPQTVKKIVDFLRTFFCLEDKTKKAETKKNFELENAINLINQKRDEINKKENEDAGKKEENKQKLIHLYPKKCRKLINAVNAVNRDRKKFIFEKLRSNKRKEEEKEEYAELQGAYAGLLLFIVMAVGLGVSAGLEVGIVVGTAVGVVVAMKTAEIAGYVDKAEEFSKKLHDEDVVAKFKKSTEREICSLDEKIDKLSRESSNKNVDHNFWGEDALKKKFFDVVNFINNSKNNQNL